MTSGCAIRYNDGWILGSDTLSTRIDKQDISYDLEAIANYKRVAKIGFFNPYIWYISAGYSIPNKTFELSNLPEYEDAHLLPVEMFIDNDNPYFKSERAFIVTGLTEKQEVKAFAKDELKEAKPLTLYGCIGSGAPRMLRSLASHFVSHCNVDIIDKKEAMEICEMMLKHSVNYDKHSCEPFEFVVLESDGFEFHVATDFLMDRITTLQKIDDFLKDFYKIYDKRE